MNGADQAAAPVSAIERIVRRNEWMWIWLDESRPLEERRAALDHSMAAVPPPVPAQAVRS